MRPITEVVVHHSASAFGSVPLIREWHLARGWSDIGYHYVIGNGHLAAGDAYDAAQDGEVAEGRPLAEVGAHALGHNADSIGICLVGDAAFTRWQYVRLIMLLVKLNAQFAFGVDNVLGHCEVDPVNKTLCPGFDMQLLRAALVCAREHQP
jgi:N-acetyl-anhydromuramyl-L-alanine amidase AmpD